MSAKPTTKGRARVNVKLAPGLERAEVDKMLADVPGLQEIVQLFPDEPDEEMRAMYILDFDPDALPAALKELRRNPKVESADPTAPRKLIR